MTTGPQDNLFEQSTMTFGSHLEELRGALIKALTGLLVGFLIGLYFANFVVEIIKVPLVSSLEQYYLEKSKKELEAEFHGIVPPEVEQTILQEGVVPDSVKVEPFWRPASETDSVSGFISSNFEASSSRPSSSV